MRRLPDEWKCDDLLIRKATLADVDVLNAICDSWEDKVKSEGEPFPQNYIKDCILYGDLPPVKEAECINYALMVIIDGGQIIGFFDMYHGYPQPDCIWISMFVIAKKYREKHYGQKLIRSITHQSAGNGWKCCGIGVSLKNWRALRFWSKNGFTRIGGINGDREYQPDAYAIIRLYNDFNNTES